MNGLNGQSSPQQQGVDGRQEVSITLPINTWNIVLSCLSEAPWKTAAPLIEEFHRQIKAVVEAPRPTPHDRPQP
jgi:hypothetical protein